MYYYTSDTPVLKPNGNPRTIAKSSLADMQKVRNSSPVH